jgi:hypothetical protein
MKKISSLFILLFVLGTMGEVLAGNAVVGQSMGRPGETKKTAAIGKSMNSSQAVVGVAGSSPAVGNAAVPQMSTHDAKIEEKSEVKEVPQMSTPDLKLVEPQVK